MTIELAGVREDDLDIELYPDAVIVDGYRTSQSCDGDAIYHSLQIRHGPFRIEIPLPGDVNIDRPDATFENGILRISLPKTSAESS
jgi:HSP20 family protein